MTERSYMAVGYQIMTRHLYDDEGHLYLGGGIRFPEGHPYHGVRHDEFPVNGEWGWTFSHLVEDGTWEIGFVFYPEDPVTFHPLAINIELIRVARYIRFNGQN
jgi:hypothetical protein